ncbi:MAG: hypothetical protein V1821_04255 [bacterium]
MFEIFGERLARHFPGSKNPETSQERETASGVVNELARVLRRTYGETYDQAMSWIASQIKADSAKARAVIQQRGTVEKIIGIARSSSAEVNLGVSQLLGALGFKTVVFEAEQARKLNSEELEKYLSNTILSACGLVEVDVASLERIVEYSKVSPEVQAIVKGTIIARYGRKYGGMIVNAGSKEFQDYQRLAQNLRATEPLGVELKKRLNIQELLEIYEILGPEVGTIAKNLDIADVAENHFVLKTGTDIVSLSLAETQDTCVQFSFEYDSPEGEVAISRSFYRTPEKTSQPSKLDVWFNLIELPSGLQGQNLGKEIMKRSLAEHDRLGVDCIKLYAGLSMGSYAWARYGFGFDPEHLAKNREAVKYISDRALWRLNRLIQKGALDSNDWRVREVQNTYEEFAKDPDLVTPQMLADACLDIKVNDVPLSKAVMFGSGAEWYGVLRTSLDESGQPSTQRRVMEDYLKSGSSKRDPATEVGLIEDYVKGLERVDPEAARQAYQSLAKKYPRSERYDSWQEKIEKLS